MLETPTALSETYNSHGRQLLAPQTLKYREYAPRTSAHCEHVLSVLETVAQDRVTVKRTEQALYFPSATILRDALATSQGKVAPWERASDTLTTPGAAFCPTTNGGDADRVPAPSSPQPTWTGIDPLALQSPSRSAPSETRFRVDAR